MPFHCPDHWSCSLATREPCTTFHGSSIWTFCCRSIRSGQHDESTCSRNHGCYGRSINSTYNQVAFPVTRNQAILHPVGPKWVPRSVDSVHAAQHLRYASVANRGSDPNSWSLVASTHHRDRHKSRDRCFRGSHETRDCLAIEARV